MPPSKTITVRLTWIEWDGIRDAARAEGLSIPEFFREVAYGRATPVGLAPGDRQRRNREANVAKIA